MECKSCSSTNVERLSHYWQSLPAESPLRASYAPPGEVQASYWVALLATLLGIVAVTSGAVVLGLLVAVGGLAWGAVVYRSVQAYELSLADWNARTICLACTGQF
ncbi:hypothetical protein [Streptomyces triticiradicis]|uniref:Uncharacterized protein n=1 Tax=Streptomyces triticiradicis TaxID=2651189 RepID=A0A7J5D522_9ACTN|nr:hypothetical protein [Streptomyces triticiradicis]KAB1979237.1 hypothetical protein F8144_36345 [Streptomyces triticiradicis]